ncbi:hypothetical protein M8845_18540, partial [Gelidibacter japonicus]|uniref:hypothetical protein n=1 Tax=Gelidibacter japonicus TaxID=1962232 RepID=UPI0020218D3D
LLIYSPTSFILNVGNKLKKPMNTKCKLCKVNDLEDVGSHIFTESIIRTALNEDGFTKRADKELMFEISVNKVGLDFFGSAIQPEKIQEITGKPVTEEQIAGNENELINKKLVCRECENKFNPIETAFAQEIYSKIVKKSNSDLKKDTCNYIAFEDKKLIALQFVIINVWRASASNYDNWKLTDDQEEYLRSFILKTVYDDLDSIIKRTQEFENEISDFDFALNYFIQDGEHLSDNGVLIDNSVNPYFILLNRLSIVFDFKKINNEEIPEFLTTIIEDNIACIISSQQENELRIGINSDEQRKLLFNRIARHQMHQIIKKCNDTFYELHRKFLGFYPPQSSTAYYVKTMQNYVTERKGKIDIQEMLNIIIQVVSDCGRSYL